MSSPPEILSRQPGEKALLGTITTIYIITSIVHSCSCRSGYNTEHPVTVDTTIRIDFIPAGAALLLPYTLGSPGSRTPCLGMPDRGYPT